MVNALRWKGMAAVSHSVGWILREQAYCLDNVVEQTYFRKIFANRVKCDLIEIREILSFLLLPYSSQMPHCSETINTNLWKSYNETMDNLYF